MKNCSDKNSRIAPNGLNAWEKFNLLSDDSGLPNPAIKGLALFQGKKVRWQSQIMQPGKKYIDQNEQPAKTGKYQYYKVPFYYQAYFIAIFPHNHCRRHRE